MDIPKEEIKPHLKTKNFRLSNPNSKKLSKIIGNYLLGKGGSAHVYKAIELHTKSEVAIKVINLSNLSSKREEHIKNEIEIQKGLSHPNIPRIYEIIEGKDKVCIVMELIKGQDLFEHVFKHGPLKESQAVHIMHQIIKAVIYLHRLGICHRDIKTENIMIDSNFNAKLIDFGLAKRFNLEKEEFFTTFCGSPSYTPPEMIDKCNYSGKFVDVWCLGVTLYVMIEACLPFDQEDKETLKNNISTFNYLPPIFSSYEAIEVYKRIFVLPENRTGLDGILKSGLFGKYISTTETRFEIKSFEKEMFLNKYHIELMDEEKDGILKTEEEKQLNGNSVMIDFLSEKEKAKIHLFSEIKNNTRRYSTGNRERLKSEMEAKSPKKQLRFSTLSKKTVKEKDPKRSIYIETNIEKRKLNGKKIRLSEQLDIKEKLYESINVRKKIKSENAQLTFIKLQHQ